MRETTSEGTNETPGKDSESERARFNPRDWLARLRESGGRTTDEASEAGPGSDRAAESASERLAGIPRHEVEPGRYLDPGPEVEAGLEREHTLGGLDGYSRWLDQINPNFEAFPPGSAEAIPWRNNCGECSRRFADAYQGIDVHAAWGDDRKLDGEAAAWEYEEMWQWAGTRPTARLENPDPERAGDFTGDSWRRTDSALRRLPVGTVAIVGVDWESQDPSVDRQEAGGHWFNAVVEPDGVKWVDAQSGETTGWPPRYGGAIWGLEAIARRPGGRWEGVDVVRG